MDKITLKTLEVNKAFIHVVGRTSYRTATVKNVVFTCDRNEISFLEDRIKNKDNHVVLIFQLLMGQFTGTYYAFLTDFSCIVGTEIEYSNY